MYFRAGNKIGFGGFGSVLSSSGAFLGNILGTDDGAAIVTDSGVAFEIGLPSVNSLTLTYYTGGGGAVDDYCNNGGGSGFGVYSTSDDAEYFQSRVTIGSVLQVTDGSTSYTMTITSVSWDGETLSLHYSENTGDELYPDSTAVTLTRIS